LFCQLIRDANDSPYPSRRLITFHDNIKLKALHTSSWLASESVSALLVLLSFSHISGSLRKFSGQMFEVSPVNLPKFVRSKIRILHTPLYARRFLFNTRVPQRNFGLGLGDSCTLHGKLGSIPSTAFALLIRVLDRATFGLPYESRFILVPIAFNRLPRVFFSRPINVRWIC
jgi:hypothetical protein